jgi:Putative DNA-binding domain
VSSFDSSIHDSSIHTDELHRRNVEQALSEQAEGNWHDFKEFASNDGKIDEFLKDIVAFANTPGGPYGGYGYIIIGVVDGTFELVGLKGKDETVTADQRTLQLSQMITKWVVPYLDVKVFNHTVDDKTVQCIVIPQAPGSWHMVSSDKQSGFWVRRGTQSARPTYQDFEDHQRRLIGREVAPLREQIARLEHRHGEQRYQLQNLQQQRNPENESAAHMAKRCLMTPEHALLANVRGELVTFREQHLLVMTEVEYFQPDRLLKLTQDRTPERLGELKTLVERIEAISRPLVEALAVLIHANAPTDLIRRATSEIAGVFTERAYSQVKENPGLVGLRSYHAQLLLYGAATASFCASDLTLLGIVLHHRRKEQEPSLSGLTRERNLASVLNVRGPLDELVMLLESGTPHQATVERMQRLLLQSDWVGATLPVIDQPQTFSRAEALLTLGYVAAALHAGVSQPPSPDPAWWRYLEADDLLRAAVNRLYLNPMPILGKLTRERFVQAFDQLEKPLTHRLQAKLETLAPLPENPFFVATV